jgi:hypothetical protein
VEDGKPFYAISAATQAGVRELVQAMARALEEISERASAIQVLDDDDARLAS